MIGRMVARFAIALGLVLALPSSAFAQGDWAGIWMSGTVRTLIVQDGQRVYGAFERIGEFDGLVSADGATVRAVVTSSQTGQRLYAELRKAGPDFVIGTVSERRFPSTGGAVWQGRLHMSERTETDPGPMSFYAGNNQSYSSPVAYANAPDPDIDSWLRFDRPTLPGPGAANDPSNWTPDHITPDIRPFATGETQSNSQQSDSSGGPWEGYWGENNRSWGLAQIDRRVVGSLSNDGILTYLEGRVSPSGRTLRLVLDRPDGTIGYLEAMMNGDNASFSGSVSTSPGALGGAIDASRQETFRPDIPLDFDYFPRAWNGRPPANVAAWLDGGDDLAAPPTATGSLAGRWSGDFTGTQFGPFGPSARIELASPHADGVTIGEITRQGQNNALLYGRMLSDAEFRGVFILMDGQGRNPTGQWGTIRLLGNAANERLEGWWAYSYRMPMGGTRGGVPGGSLSAQPTNSAGNAAVVSWDRLGVERAFVALEQFSGPMPLFNPELPKGEVLFALQRWWRGEGELCAAGCTPVQPTRLVVDALRIVPQPPHALIPRTPIYATLYRVRLNVDVRFRDEAGRVTRSPDTGGGVSLVDPRYLFNDQVRVQNYAVSGRPQPRVDEPLGYCDALETTTQLGENRRTAIVNLPETLLMSPYSDITLAVTAEVELAGELLGSPLGPRTVSFDVFGRAAEVAAYRAANGHGRRPVQDLGCDRGHIWLERRGSDEAFELSVRWEFLP